VAEKKFFSTGYTGDPPEQHTGVFPSQLQQFLQDRLHRCYGTGLTGAATSAVRKANGYFRAVSDRLHRCPLTSLPGALRRKAPMASNGSIDLVGYIYAIPRPFEVCWSSGATHPHPRTSPSHPRA